MFASFFALVTAVIVAVLSSIISRLLKEKIAMAIGFGVFFTLFTWLISRFSSKVSPEIAMLLLALGVIMVVVLIVRWFIGGSTIKEAITFIVLDLLLMLTNLQAATRIYDLSSKSGVRGVVVSIPKIFFLLSIAFFILDMIQFKDHLRKATPEELDEDLDFYDDPLKSFKEVYTPFEDYLEDEEEKEETEGDSDDSEGSEESEDEYDPIDFGLLSEYDEKGGINDAQYAS
ncbi:hypothetical protein J6S55_02035 [Candidatus Saccharibacteria bacterium]|nr:hypothetical protein [Candidatus Saccharibacteria bacterium]